MSIEQRGSGDGDTSYLTRVGRNSPAIKAFIGISTRRRTVSRRVLDRPSVRLTRPISLLLKDVPASLRFGAPQPRVSGSLSNWPRRRLGGVGFRPTSHGCPHRHRLILYQSPFPFKYSRLTWIAVKGSPSQKSCSTTNHSQPAAWPCSIIVAKSRLPRPTSAISGIFFRGLNL